MFAKAGPRLFDRMAHHRRKITDQAITDAAGNRQLVLAFEFFDRARCGFIENTARPDLTVAVLRQGALHGCDAWRLGDEVGDRIVMPDGDRLRIDRRRRRARRRRLDRLRMILDRNQPRRRIGKERRRMRTRLQKQGIHDDNNAGHGRRDNGN